MAPKRGHSQKHNTRPAATSSFSAASNPAASASTSNILSAYSPSAALFALVTLAVDKHRVRIYDSSALSGASSAAGSGTLGQAVADYVIPDARCASLAWGSYPSATSTPTETPNSKKRKKDGKEAAAPKASSSASSPAVPVLALGLSNGSVHLFSPSHGRVLRVLGHPSATTPVTGVAFSDEHVPGAAKVWTSSEDGVVRSWSLGTHRSDEPEVVHRHKPDDRTSVRTLSLRPCADPSTTTTTTQLLAAHHSIKLLSFSSASAAPRTLATFTGHASPLTRMVWLPPAPGSTKPTRFVSAAEGDRVAYLWEIPSVSDEDKDESGVKSVVREGRTIANIPADAEIRHLAVAPSPSAGGAETLLVLTQEGDVSLFALPLYSDMTASSTKTSSPKKKSAIPTLKAASSLKLSLVSSSSSPSKQKKGSDVVTSTANDVADTIVLDATFTSQSGTGDSNQLQRLAFVRLVRGAKPVFESVAFRDAETGAYVPSIDVTRRKMGGGVLVDTGDEDSLGDAAKLQRYSEPAKSSVRTGLDVSSAAAFKGDGAVFDDADLAAAMGGAEEQAELDPNDLDSTEPTLAQRLRGLAVQHGEGKKGASEDSGEGEEDDEREGDEDTSGRRRRRHSSSAIAPAPTASLAHTLTQALHSGDSTLLSSCLVHSEPSLVRNTVKRLPGPLVVRLLEACVERMSHGGVKSKGALGTGRARGLIEWVRQCLVCHTGYLMTLPSLVTRLSHLHTALSSRLSTHDRLLSLNGRLELVLSQIDLRSHYAPSLGGAQVSASLRSGGGRAARRRKGKAAAGGGGNEGLEGPGPAKYVEGESSSSESEGDMEVDGEGEGMDVEDASETGSIEDVALGGDEEEDEEDVDLDLEDEEDDEDDDDEDEDEDEDEEEDDEGRPNGFLELEASEEDEGDSDEEEEEE